MLKMKPHCEKCHAATPHEGPAYICSFECTFCTTCAAAMQHTCPNCQGRLMARPPRTRGVAAVGLARLRDRLFRR